MFAVVGNFESYFLRYRLVLLIDLRLTLNKVHPQLSVPRTWPCKVGSLSGIFARSVQVKRYIEPQRRDSGWRVQSLLRRNQFVKIRIMLPSSINLCMTLEFV
ncbi:hypothetical protein M758_1G180800 [Ceratodon purpureus]|nr:hypothetical protein M758_1G180800 [Ceratodon purpureus]